MRFILVFFSLVLSPPYLWLSPSPFVFGVDESLLFLILEFSLSEFLLSLDEFELLYSTITFSFSSRIEHDSLGYSDTFDITDMWAWPGRDDRWN